MIYLVFFLYFYNKSNLPLLDSYSTILSTPPLSAKWMNADEEVSDSDSEPGNFLKLVIVRTKKMKEEDAEEDNTVEVRDTEKCPSPKSLMPAKNTSAKKAVSSLGTTGSVSGITS